MALGTLKIIWKQICASPMVAVEEVARCGRILLFRPFCTVIGGKISQVVGGWNTFSERGGRASVMGGWSANASFAQLAAVWSRESKERRNRAMQSQTKIQFFAKYFCTTNVFLHLCQLESCSPTSASLITSPTLFWFSKFLALGKKIYLKANTCKPKMVALR